MNKDQLAIMTEKVNSLMGTVKPNMKRVSKRCLGGCGKTFLTTSKRICPACAKHNATMGYMVNMI